MSSLKAHVNLQEDPAESIPCNGDKDLWLWLEAERTNLAQKLLLMAPTSFRVTPEGGITAAPRTAPLAAAEQDPVPPQLHATPWRYFWWTQPLDVALGPSGSNCLCLCSSGTRS